MTCPACAALRAEVERLTESVVTTGNLNLQLAREVDTADADAERLAGALHHLSKAVETITGIPDVEIAEALYISELGDAEEALRQHEERVK